MIAFEPSKEKFKLLKKNISKNKSIEGFNFAIIGKKNLKEIIFFERDPFDFCSSRFYQKKLTKGKIKYFYMFNKGISKNRNNCLKNSKSEICHICDDDLIYLKDFSKIIKNKYEKSKDYDLITFNAVDEKNEKRFKIKDQKHNLLTILKVSSIGITFKRKVVLNNKIKFDENFGLGSKWICGEENIFLKNCLDKKLKLFHCDKNIVFHKSESSGMIYRDELIISRIKVFKKLFGFFGAVLAVFYLTIFKYKEYKNKYKFYKHFWLSFKGLY